MKAHGFTITLLAMLSSASVIAQEPVPLAGQRVVTVMTQNVYNGVDDKLDALLTATSSDLPQKVAEAFQAYFTRNFHERAAALAAEIEATQPHLIGLQEAVLVRTQSPPDGPKTPATTVAFDYVQILLEALTRRGLHYEVVVQSPNLDAELPSALSFDVRHTDREVILARTDLNPADFKLSNPQGRNFVTNCTSTIQGVGSITFLRGWVAVDVTIRGKSFRLISTHLDLACPPPPFTSVQRAQAAEVLSGPATTELPVVVVGDFNSPGDGSGPTYNDVIAAGFVDAAVAAGVGSIPTCCQDVHLLNPDSNLKIRTDFVLFRGTFKALDAHIVGDNQADRTPSRFWPSDHAGVAARLELPDGLPDRCGPIENRLVEIEDKIRETEALPEARGPHFSEILKRLRRQREQLILQLKTCRETSSDARPAHPVTQKRAERFRPVLSPPRKIGLSITKVRSSAEARVGSA